MARSKGGTISLKLRKLILGTTSSQAYLRERLSHSRDCGQRTWYTMPGMWSLTGEGVRRQWAAQPRVA